MKRWGIVLLVLVSAVPAEDLDGKIKGGKAKKLVDKAKPLLAEAFELRKKLLFHKEPESDAYGAMVKKCVELYDKGSMCLVEALEIQYDAGVNAMLLRASRDLAKSRAALFQFENRRRWCEREKERKEKGEKPEPEPEEPKPAPELTEEEKEKPPPAPEFKPRTPPATPRHVVFKELAASSDPDAAARNVKERLKQYYNARRKGKLRVRCKLCAGKGKYRDGSSCEDCGATGHQVNLFYFRQVYWNAYSPMFRASEGALPALKEFLGHARSDPALMVDDVKSFKILSIDAHQYIAHATVKVKTAEGEREDRFTLVGIGSAWYFFVPESDSELVP